MQPERDIVPEVHHLAGKIGNGKREIVFVYVYADEEPGGGVESIEAWTPSVCRFLLAQIDQQAGFHHLADYPGYPWDACIHGAGYVGKGYSRHFLAHGEDSLLLRSIAAGNVFGEWIHKTTVLPHKYSNKS